MGFSGNPSASQSKVTIETRNGQDWHILCYFCSMTFENKAGRGGHIHSCHRTEYNTRKQQLIKNKKLRRLRPKWPFKKHVLDVCVNNPGLSHVDVGLVHSCTSSQISKWMKIRFNEELWKNSPDAQKPQRAESRAKFKVAETELYDRFLHRRKTQGLFVDGLWLRKEMRKILGTEATWLPRL